MTTRRSAQTRYSPRLLLVALFAAAFAVSPVWADSPIPALPADGAISPEQIESAIAAIEAREGLDEETRVRVIDQLRDAQAQLQNASSARVSAAAFAESIQTAPAETAKLRRQLDEAPPDVPTAESLGIRESTPWAELSRISASPRKRLSTKSR